MSAAENVIGGIVGGGKAAYWRVADLLNAEDFPTPLLAKLYRLCKEMATEPGDMDVITLGDEAGRRGINPADVTALAAATASYANIRAYAELVKADAMTRRVKVICGAGSATGDVATVQAELSVLLAAQPAHAATSADVIKRMWAGVMARYEAKDELSGIPTGFPKIDELTGGLQPGRVYGIGARAKMGKTILAMNICANVALAGKPVAVWSLEMTDEELMQRMTCAVASVQSFGLQHPKRMEQDEWSRMAVATERLRDAPLRVSDHTDVTIEQIEAQVRQMHAMGQCELLCIDYLGLLRMPKMDRHDLSIAHCTRRVKIIAKELRIPVLLVFQLNRGSENGGVVRAPRPSDARDSGSIEQDVDAMFLLHRPSYYDKAAPSGLRLDLALQRNGPTGLIRLEDELDRCRFAPSEYEWTDPKARGGKENDL